MLRQVSDRHFFVVETASDDRALPERQGAETASGRRHQGSSACQVRLQSGELRRCGPVRTSVFGQQTFPYLRLIYG